jgi:hypothetical protein
MNKAALSIFLVISLLFPATLLVDRVYAAPSFPVPTGPLNPPVISITSPVSTTYVSWFVPLNFSVTGSWDGYLENCVVSLSLDSAAKYVIYEPFRVKEVAESFSITLGPLSEGRHQLQVYSTVGGVYRTGPDSTSLSSGDFTSEALVSFTVNTAGQAQISILSPVNQTYNYNKNIPVDFSVNKEESIVSMGFTLDEKLNVTIPRNTTLYGPLSDGTHTLRVYSVFSDVLSASSTVNFTVDTTAPNVSVLSVQDKTYNSSNIPLVFEVNETTSLITYVLDKRVYTVYGNASLTELQNGKHQLIVYATDEVGNAGNSETIDFNVAVPLTPQMAYGVLPPMAIVLIGGLSVLIYLRIRKQSASKKHLNHRHLNS